MRSISTGADQSLKTSHSELQLPIRDNEEENESVTEPLVINITQATLGQPPGSRDKPEEDTKFPTKSPVITNTRCDTDSVPQRNQYLMINQYLESYQYLDDRYLERNQYMDRLQYLNNCQHVVKHDMGAVIETSLPTVNETATNTALDG